MKNSGVTAARAFSLVITVCSIATLNGGYVVTTPRQWSAEEESQVCVIVSSPFTEEDTVSVEVTQEYHGDGPQLDNITHLLNPKEVLLPHGKTHICDTFVLPNSEERYGGIIVTGSLGGKTLNHSRPLKIRSTTVQTFIQTDKTLYKPSQAVQFRILSARSPNLKVLLDQYDEIWIENPSGTRIKQWRNVPNGKGLVHLSFTLADEPEEGTYKINVRSPFGQNKQTFKVEEYVLPRYEVIIEPPPFVLGSEDEFTFEVCAKYTFGKPVRGELTLYLNIIQLRGWRRETASLEKKEKIYGCQNVTMALSAIPKILDRVASTSSRVAYTSSITGSVDVAEEGTGVVVKSKPVTVSVTKEAAVFHLLDVQGAQKPELPYIAQVKVMLVDGSPLVKEPIRVSCFGITYYVPTLNSTLTTDSDGILKFGIPPHLRCRVVRLTALNYLSTGHFGQGTILRSSTRSISLTQHTSASNSSLEIDKTNLECSSSAESIDFQLPVRFAAVEQDHAVLTVQVISRGQIQFSNTFNQSLAVGVNVDANVQFLTPLVEPATKNLVRGRFSIPISLPKTVSPAIKVIVWYARPDGEVVSDAKELHVTECLPSTVDLSWSALKAQPGDAATLSIKAEPFSLCSLGVVDKSVQLMSDKESPLSVKVLLKLAAKDSIPSYVNNKIDDHKYCREQLKKDEANNAGVSTRTWGQFVTNGRDALYSFDEAGIYIFSDLTTLETQPCKGKKRIFSSRWRSAGGGSANERVPFSGGGVRNSGPTPGETATKPESAHNAVEEQRTYFPETWLWDLFTLGENGVTNETLTLPDSVTEWVGSAVCVHPTKGVGISPASSIITFRDFFADLTLPPSVKRGEIFPVKISVFNYLNEPLPLKVILEESTEYDILGNEAGEDVEASGERSSCLPPQEKVVHAIRIRPKAFGDVNITVSAFVDANSTDACGQAITHYRRDVLVKPIRVEIEGFLKEKTWSQYVCTKELEMGEEALEAWSVEAPGPIIPDSARGFVAVVGDLLGPTLENLGHLVRLPTGCGEQNMISFAPNIFVMQYLEAAALDKEETSKTAIKYMEVGYQRELRYRHSDGSFSAFGENDDSGSTWLTAFVLKSFAQARAYISVDESDLTRTRDWLVTKQLQGGCFQSVGKVLHKSMKGGLGNSTAPQTLLSSFALISLLEAGEKDTNESYVIRDAIQCITELVSSSKNPYGISLKSYALALAGSPKAQEAIDELFSLATRTQNLHWEIPNEYGPSQGVGIETAGYAVLALITQQANTGRDYSGDIRKIIRWISKQRNGYGGFISTQDTIVALQAMAAFERTTPESPTNLTLLLTMGDLDTPFTVDDHNKLLQQKVAMPSIPTTVAYFIEGQGCALLQATVRYNVPDPEASEAFNVSVRSAAEPDQACHTHRINVCASYLLEDLTSNMAIIEVNLVSGYIPEKADLKAIVESGAPYKRYEVDGSTVNIYMDELTEEERCVSFRVHKEVEVEEPKPGSVRVYDYYKPEYFVTEKYTLNADECSNSIA